MSGVISLIFLVASFKASDTCYFKDSISVTWNGFLKEGSFKSSIVSAFVMSDAGLICLRLKLILIESPEACTECQIPAG